MESDSHQGWEVLRVSRQDIDMKCYKAGCEKALLSHGAVENGQGIFWKYYGDSLSCVHISGGGLGLARG